jgi:hypothetical protein
MNMNRLVTYAKLADNTEWQKVGEVGVDTAQLMLGDPCCIEDALNAWEEFCASMRGRGDFPTCHQLHYQAGHPGLGFMVETGYGDGLYPVYVRRNAEGRIVEMKVVFVEDENE